VHSKSALVATLLSPILLWAKIGAGDVKLLLICAFYFLPFNFAAFSQFLIGFSSISSASVLISSVKMRTLRANIALAPAICGAVIWCAR